jgi:hypothetical protein
MRWLSTWFLTRILRRNRNITYKLAPPTKLRDFRFRPQMLVLEDRNAPGSILNGLGSVMLDGSLSVPLAEMASVVGESALYSSPVAGANRELTQPGSPEPAWDGLPTTPTVDSTNSVSYSAAGNPTTNANPLIPP